jgi:ATP-dependent Lon protease
MKTDLPVILLKGIVLLPSNDLKLEIDGNVSHNIIDVAEMFHDDKVLVVSQVDPLEETPGINDLPKIGVIARISKKIDLPNGKIRLSLNAISRARVYEYLNDNKSDGILEAIVSELKPVEPNEEENELLVKKLCNDVENYAKKVPYISNSFFNEMFSSNDLAKVTDIIAPNLGVGLDRLREYLNEVSSTRRMEMILKDIYKELEMVNIEREFDMKVRFQMDQTQREYILREKLKNIKQELGDISAKDEEIDTLREKLDNLDLPKIIYDKIEKEIKKYEMLTINSPELSLTRTYIEWMLDLPWGVYTEDNENLKDVKKKLDESHYGIEDVKTRIIEYLAVKKMTNSLRGPIICLVGPPGVGKTSLVSSIAKAINRNFVKVAVGGVHDESEIRGHRRTYLGANPGRIITAIKKAKSSNPVFLIDEIDKMTADIKGDPASALLEVLDPEQNKFYSDNFIEEDYDLSKVMFIVTANYIEKIPEALKDRLEIVELSGYTEYEKVDIAKKHLIPKICEEHGINESNIIFDDDSLTHIIRYYTKEAGVRELERQLSKIIRKIITSIVTTNIKVSKLNITEDNLIKYLGKEKYSSGILSEYQIGVVNGLAYTSFGGDTLPIEVNYYKGTGKLELTGSLGNVMKESAIIALSYIKSNCDKFDIDYDTLCNSDIHIHVPEGATPKDGPSAGVTLTTSLINAFTNLKVDSTIAMTGEITLRGTILPIGGLKEKSIGANRKGINTVFVPEGNINDIENLPKEIKENISFIPVKDYIQIYNHIKGDKNEK